MTDRYAVIGNPVAHSRSPEIHGQFAAQTGQRISYERLLAPLDGFLASVEHFRAQGGCGLNVTVPFKLQAFEYAQRRSERAQAAGALNTLVFGDEQVYGDNTDGVGMVRDITGRLQVPLDGSSILIAGAGGAARGVLLPLLQAGARCVVVANRTESKALELAQIADDSRVIGCGFEALTANRAAGDEFDVVINATSTGLSDAAPPLPDDCYRAARLAYDMVYGARPTRFMQRAIELGCSNVSDGLGMLVEQAAESFRIWRGVMPETEPVYLRLRESLALA